jgi:hypothetical protein
MRIFRMALAAGLLAFAIQPAQAQRDPSRAMRLGEAPSSAQDLRILDRFARCVAGRRENAATAILATDPSTSDYRNGMRRLAQSNWGCLGSGTLKFNEILFAGGLAEALLRRGNASTNIAARTAHDPSRIALQARDEAELMSICTVRAAPAQVEALLASEVASPEEAAAVRALMPQIGQCLSAGVNMRLNRPALRAALALAIHRLVRHNALVQPAAARR